MNVRLPFRMEKDMQENLCSWYDRVKDNDKCVFAENLNDPFYQRRQINFIMDLSGTEIFEKEINYVTVNVRKMRASGNDFYKSATIDLKYLKEQGNVAKISFARENNEDNGTFEYQSQWSIRNGYIWPGNAPWVKGTWEAVTLSPPITAKSIEFMCSPDQLKAMNINLVTLEVRFMKFGKECEESISISPFKNEPSALKTIYIDKDTKGYAYRLVFDHAKKGKLALDWQAKINNYTIFANIPPELYDESSILFKNAIDSGKSTEDDKNVLDSFRYLFDKPKSN